MPNCLLETIEILNSQYVPVKMAYIDPGTGSMLFTIIIGLISTVIYGLRGLILKLKYKGNVKDKKDSNRYDFVIFSDSKRYWNIFESICDEFEKRKIKLRYLTMSEDDKVFIKKYEYISPEYIGNNNSAFTKMNLLKADVVLSTTPGLDVYQWKRSKDVNSYVHIPHMINDITTYRMFGIDYYDAVLTCNKFQTKQVRKLEEIRNLKEKEILEVGCTYFDDMKNRLNSIKHIKNDRPVVLLAPSWGESGILKRFGEKIIDKLIETGYEIVVRPHPQSFTSEKEMIDNLMNKYPNIEWNRDTDNFGILERSDILISDFSGVIFDYSLVFDKPIIYTNTNFDKSPYDAWWIEDELWTFSILPSIGKELSLKNFDNIKGLIDDCINNKSFKEGRDKARNEAWFNVGNSASLVTDYLVKKQEDISKC